MRISIKESKRENRYIKPFVDFYVSSYFPQIRKIKIDVDCPDKDNRQKLPDYFITQPKILVELKEVHERERLEASAAWSYNVRRLEKELKLRNLSLIQGSYLVNTPAVLKVKRGKEKQVIDEIIRAIEDNQVEVGISTLGKFEIHKYSEEGNVVGFGLIGPSRWIDPAGTIHKNVGPKIDTANKQLGSFKNDRVNKRILLLVNKYIFGDRITEFLEALTYSFDKLLKYQHIDEIWLQVELSNGKFLHTCLYLRDFLISFDKEDISLDRQPLKLLEKWFYPLSKLGDKYKEKLFLALKKVLKNKKPHQVFSNRFAREEMVRLGIWLADRGEFEQTNWLIKQFINDPNPEEPKDYLGDPEFNYHQQIAKGEDPHVITTVLGHLAWVIQKLAAQKEEKNKKYTIRAFGYTKKLINDHENYYVKLQAIIPLIEIAKRRQWLTGWGRRPIKNEYKEFYKVVFSLIKIIEDNPKSIAIAKWLCNVFAYYKDLSTKETIRVLDALRITEESASLFIYYGIYRKNHYQDLGIKFKGEDLEEKLEKLIRSVTKKDQGLRGNLAWNFWKLLDENPKEFEKLKEWISIFIELPYDKRIYTSLLRVIEDWIDKKPNVCISWYTTLMANIVKEINTEEKARNFWLTTKTGKILVEIAKKEPGELSDIVKKLIELWKLGSFVGSPKEIFESFKEIRDDNLRKIIKKQFQGWYKQMQKKNSKLERVNWNN